MHLIKSKNLANILFGIAIFLLIVPISFFNSNFSLHPYSYRFFLIIILFSLAGKFNHNLFVIFSFVFSFIVLFSLPSMPAGLLSPVLFSFVVIYFVLAYRGDVLGIKRMKHWVYWFTLIFLCLTVYVIFEHFYYGLTWSTRSKGYGSGTGHAVMSLLIINYVHLNLNLNNRMKFLLYLVCFTILALLQSRGVLLTWFALATYRIGIGSKFRLLLLLGIGVFCVLMFREYFFTLGFLARFVIEDGDSINQLTSGRYDTLELLIGNYIHSDIFTLIGGFGLNSISNLIYGNDLEFPHLDLVFVIYELGLTGLLFYIWLNYRLWKLFPSKSFLFIVIISSLHTNIILGPSIYAVAYMFSLTSHKKVSGV